MCKHKNAEKIREHFPVIREHFPWRDMRCVKCDEVGCQLAGETVISWGEKIILSPPNRVGGLEYFPETGEYGAEVVITKRRLTRVNRRENPDLAYEAMSPLHSATLG